MKKHNFKSISQQGFTLLESLVGLVIFSIIICGSGLAISKMLKTQSNMNIDNIIINELQSRLQIAQQMDATANLCEATAFKTNIEFKGKIYFVACAIFSTDIEALKSMSNPSKISWPVLTASAKSKAVAEQCAQGEADSSCYTVGR